MFCWVGEREKERLLGQYFNGKVGVEWELMGIESTFTFELKLFVGFLLGLLDSFSSWFLQLFLLSWFGIATV